MPKDVELKIDSLQVVGPKTPKGGGEEYYILEVYGNGEKYVRFMPNPNHDLSVGDLVKIVYSQYKSGNTMNNRIVQYDKQGSSAKNIASFPWRTNPIPPVPWESDTTKSTLSPKELSIVRQSSLRSAVEAIPHIRSSRVTVQDVFDIADAFTEYALAPYKKG